jgi:predicted membrane metal-binding protein
MAAIHLRELAVMSDELLYPIVIVVFVGTVLRSWRQFRDDPKRPVNAGRRYIHHGPRVLFSVGLLWMLSLVELSMFFSPPGWLGVIVVIPFLTLLLLAFLWNLIAGTPDNPRRLRSRWEHEAFDAQEELELRQAVNRAGKVSLRSRPSRRRPDR